MIYHLTILIDELAPILSAPASIIFNAFSLFLIPPEAFIFALFFTTDLINSTSSTSAPPVLKPVEVLTKSAPASKMISEALTIFSFVAFTTDSISFFTNRYSLFFIAAILITMSISSAPFSRASSVSKAFTLERLFPKGNPITVATKTSVFLRISEAYFTYMGLIHTALKLYSLASSQILFISSFLASGFNIVWSIYFDKLSIIFTTLLFLLLHSFLILLHFLLLHQHAFLKQSLLLL